MASELFEHFIRINNTSSNEWESGFFSVCLTTNVYQNSFLLVCWTYVRNQRTRCVRLTAAATTTKTKLWWRKKYQGYAYNNNNFLSLCKFYDTIFFLPTFFLPTLVIKLSVLVTQFRSCVHNPNITRCLRPICDQSRIVHILILIEMNQFHHCFNCILKPPFLWHQIVCQLIWHTKTYSQHIYLISAKIRQEFHWTLLNTLSYYILTSMQMEQ